MNAIIRNGRPIAALVLATIAAASFAPAAYADHGNKVRGYRGPTPVVVQRGWYPSSSRYVVHRSSAGPVFASLVGGMILGAALANAAPPPPPCPYVYVDPYCGSRWSTFDDCAAHLSYHAGPRLVQVVDVRSGACVTTWCWRHGGWEEWND